MKPKNPKRVAQGKKLAALRKEKKRLMNGNNDDSKESESSAINVTYIASIFGIVVGAIHIYKWLFPGSDRNCPALQPVVHEREVDNKSKPKLPEPEPNIITLD